MFNFDNRILRLTKNFNLPSTKISILGMVFISLIFGFLIDNYALGLPNNSSAIYRMLVYFIIFGAMSILSGFLTTILINSSQGNPIKMKHSMLLSLFLMTIVSGLYFLTGSLYSPFSEYFINNLLFGCSAIFAIRIMTIWSISNIGFLKSSIISAIQPISIIVAFLILFIPYIRSPYFTAIVFIKILLAFLILMTAIYLFIRVIESPIKRNYGISGLELVSLFISHFTHNSQKMEEIFEDLGENITAPIGIFSFKNKNGPKALFLTPCIHPGPAGNLGGANMPTILAKKFDIFTMVAHGPCTHDFNPVSAREIDKIHSVVKNALKDMNYSNKASEFTRVQHNNAILGIQYFNENLMMLLTFAPSGADDIDFGIGFGLMNLAKASCGVNNAIMVDCHNCFKEGAVEILPGNIEVQSIIKCIENIEILEQCQGIRIGCAQDPIIDVSKKDGIGDSGVKVMVIETCNVKGVQKVAYVLLDANNMVNGFREEIIGSIDELTIDHIEVMTSDTHSVNTISNVHNPLGHKKGAEIIESVKICIGNALEDLEEVSVACKICEIENIKTFGPTFTPGFVTTIGSIVAVARSFGVLTLVLAFSIVFLLMLIPNY